MSRHNHYVEWFATYPIANSTATAQKRQVKSFYYGYAARRFAKLKARRDNVSNVTLTSYGKEASYD